MRLRALREELSRALSNPMNQRIFKDARRRHPALAGAETPRELVAMLEGAGTAGFARKDEVLRALVHEYQTSPWPRLWMTVIACAFMPTLIVIRARTRRGDERPDELDSQLLFAFQETVAGYPLDQRPGSVASGLKWDTRKRYLANLAQAQEACRFQKDLAGYAARVSGPGAGGFDPAEHALPSEDSPHWDEDDRAEMRAALDALITDGVVTREDAVLVWMTRIEQQSAAEVARQECDADSVAMSREMERVRRRRSRAEKKIFEALGRFSRPRVSRSGPKTAFPI